MDFTKNVTHETKRANHSEIFLVAIAPPGFNILPLMPDSSTRADGRSPSQFRPLRFQNGIAPYATGSTLIEWGNTRVIGGACFRAAVC
jgi:hypothetical protein